MNAPTLIAEPLGGMAGHSALAIGLVNNAAGSAAVTTERQFRAMLDAAFPGTAPMLMLYRSAAMMLDAPQAGLCGTPYLPLEGLLDARAPNRVVDALIVTGMPPQAVRLQDEPAWPCLASLADWAERHAVPVLWSCLAAHAAMLRLDGIERVRLPAKLSGLYACELAEPGHSLAYGLPSRWTAPHSRFNDVPEACLVANGYTVLSRSAEAGVDAALRRGSALSLFLQGHPEYEPDTLLREYRRDAKRFFAGDSNQLPAVPANYFDRDTEQALTALRDDTARHGRDPALLAQVLAATDRAS